MRQPVRPPGPRGALANGRALRGLTSDPVPMLDALVAEHGPTFAVGRKPMAIVVVGDPAHLGPLLATSTDAFRWGHRFNVLGFIVGSTSMIVTDGDRHRRVRGAAQPGFARRRLDAWIPLAVHEADRTLGETLSCASDAQDLYEPGRRLARRVVTRVLFGSGLGDRADEFGEILEPAMQYGVQPAMRQLPHPIPYTRRATARRALRDADLIIYEEIERRRTSRSDVAGATDVLDTLLAANPPLSRREQRDQVVTLIAAGYDTTASGLAWTLLRAAGTPGVWTKLRAEADAVLGSRSPDEFDATTLRSLRYADCVVREALRLHPPGVFSPRQATRDLVLGDFAISKGTMILWSSYVSGRLPDVWVEPLSFRPERFFAPDGAQQAAIDGAWMPFGRGPRACIGFALAQMELTLVLARVAQRADIELVNATVPRPVGMIVNRPGGGVVARVTHRRR